jgi:hypothetical protein
VELHFATSVCQVLLERFGIDNVAVRSSRAPVDRLIAMGSAAEPDDLQATDSGSSSIPALYVIFDSSSSAPTKLILESESEHPVLVIDHRSASPESSALAIAKVCSLSSSKIRAKVKKEVTALRQARMTEDAQVRTSSFRYATTIAACYDANRTVTGDGVLLLGRVRGKVRDRYFAAREANPDASDSRFQEHSQTEKDRRNQLLAIVTTDRQSGFDRMLAQVPYKGAVLNLTSAFWFRQTEHIVPNHLVSVPHPNVSLVRRCEPFPIEFVVRYVLCRRQHKE